MVSLIIKLCLVLLHMALASICLSSNLNIMIPFCLIYGNLYSVNMYLDIIPGSFSHILSNKLNEC